MKIVTVIGARPQFIKAAAVSAELSKTQGIDEILVHTGQHYDQEMSDVFFKDLNIPQPKYNLNVGGSSHGKMTGQMLIDLEIILQKEKPNVLLVYGDTNSTLAGALAATKLHIPVAHVEAGLRSFNKKMPEEINRIMTDHCSEVLFSPTKLATTHLVNEGLSEHFIVQVGDVMLDVCLLFQDMVKDEHIENFQPYISNGKFVLATVHRQENTDNRDKLLNILSGLQEVSKELPVLFPIHPRTKKCIEQFDLGEYLNGITLVPPLGYLEMVGLQMRASVIATDSGGVQKEAFFHEVPCVTLREETEWVELVDAGWNHLSPLGSSKGISEMILNSVGRKGASIQPYGNGNSAHLIIQSLLERYT